MAPVIYQPVCHSVARQCLHRCKSHHHQPFLWRYWDFRVSQLHNPWPIDIKFDAGDRRFHPSSQAKIQNNLPIWDVWAFGRTITLTWFEVFLFCDPKFCLRRPRDKTVERFLCGLLHIMLILGYCIHRWIKCRKFQFSHFLNHKTAPKRRE